MIRYIMLIVIFNCIYARVDELINPVEHVTSETPIPIDDALPDLLTTPFTPSYEALIQAVGHHDPEIDQNTLAREILGPTDKDSEKLRKKLGQSASEISKRYMDLSKAGMDGDQSTRKAFTNERLADIMKYGDSKAARHEVGHGLVEFVTNTDPSKRIHIHLSREITPESYPNPTSDLPTIPCCVRSKVVVNPLPDSLTGAQKFAAELAEMSQDELERELLVVMGGIAGDNLIRHTNSVSQHIKLAFQSTGTTTDTEKALWIAKELSNRFSKYHNPRGNTKAHLRRIIMSGYNGARQILQEHMAQWALLSKVLCDQKMLFHGQLLFVMRQYHPNWEPVSASRDYMQALRSDPKTRKHIRKKRRSKFGLPNILQARKVRKNKALKK